MTSHPASRRPGAAAHVLPIPERVVLDDGATIALHTDDCGATIVEVSGLAAGPWADALALELLALGPDVRLVIDLRGATLVNPAGLCEVLDELVAAGDDPHRLCLVCDRLSALVLLRRHGATEQVAVFASPSDALQAVLLEEEGYGDGWAPQPHAHP
ncbi:hypothetical protein [Actinomarinicola tropica]|uniref:STAS domain-containing protein n=1 Tax=Actinomarinicola tropica TaxID=2789776 RepID=A0A5Q2RKX8_9ACTN|nr:hypothetical protein [Actinomarinicola tropica]QGG95582.1 hypothetical protein GH723_11015 [Actinomarinicola tropica]